MTIKCPRCKSRQVWKKGYNPTRQGARQRYVCFPCGKTFYHDTEPVITTEEYLNRTAHMPSHWKQEFG